MAPRSIWNGTITFAQVAIPVKLYSGVEQHRIRFREVRISDGSAVSHRRVGAVSGEEIPSDQIARAYEATPGESTVLSDEDLAVASQVREKTVEIESFVERGSIDPIYFERPYVLGPQPGAEHAYRVLAAALQRRDRVGIGRFVLRSREHLVALAADGEALRLYTMRFADELVTRSDLDIPKLPKSASAKELALARQLIDALAVPWEPETHTDEHRDAVMKLIRAKAQGGEITPVIEPEKPATADLMGALKASIEQRGSGGAPAKRRAPSSHASDGSGGTTQSKRRPGTRLAPKSTSRARKKAPKS